MSRHKQFVTLYRKKFQKTVQPLEVNFSPTIPRILAHFFCGMGRAPLLLSIASRIGQQLNPLFLEGIHHDDPPHSGRNLTLFRRWCPPGCPVAAREAWWPPLGRACNAGSTHTMVGHRARTPARARATANHENLVQKLMSRSGSEIYVAHCIYGANVQSASKCVQARTNA